MSDKDTFGPCLRAERERRGISLATVAAVTNVSVEFWEGLERNDFSRWPSGIFARSFVRNYARAIGVDERDVVDDFCRWFALGDRRLTPSIAAHARLIGHQLNTSADPTEGDRRAPGADGVVAAPLGRGVATPRLAAAIVDTLTVVVLTTGASFAFQTGFYETAGVTAVLYSAVATIALGSSAGTVVVDALRRRMPALFEHAGGHRPARTARTVSHQ